MINKHVLCIGAALIDDCYSSIENPIQGTSNPSLHFRSIGGVACNVANHLALLGENVELISQFGNDLNGKWLTENCNANGVGLSNSIINDKETGQYIAFLSPSGELIYAAVISHIENSITVDFLKGKISLLKSAKLLVIDCNLHAETIQWVVAFSNENKIPLVIEPVSIPKARKLKNIFFKDVLLITPNAEEMKVMIDSSVMADEKTLANELIKRGVKNLWVRNGKNGSKIYSADSTIELPSPAISVIDATGAGDAALAGWLYAWLRNESPEKCLGYGHAMASIILQTRGAIENNLTEDLLKKTFNKINQK